MEAECRCTLSGPAKLARPNGKSASRVCALQGPEQSHLGSEEAVRPVKKGANYSRESIRRNHGLTLCAVTGVRQPASHLIADPTGNAVVTPPEDEPHDWAAVIKKTGAK